jgi:hypothetical protein
MKNQSMLSKVLLILGAALVAYALLLAGQWVCCGPRE